LLFVTSPCAADHTNVSARHRSQLRLRLSSFISKSVNFDGLVEAAQVMKKDRFAIVELPAATRP
jgi:hypothetical protein